MNASCGDCIFSVYSVWLTNSQQLNNNYNYNDNNFMEIKSDVCFYYALR